MNERSSLAFLAHLLGNHRLASSSPSTPHTALPFSFLSQALPLLDLPTPPYSRATCSFSTGGEEVALSHCFCQRPLANIRATPGRRGGRGRATWDWVSPPWWHESSPVPSATDAQF